MDAKTLVSVHISRLQDLLSEVAKTNNPTFIKEVVTAIKDLHLLEQSLQASQRQKEVSSVVKAICYAVDITDSLLIRKRENNGFTPSLLNKKESQPTNKRENNSFKKKLQWPLTYFKSSHSQDEFALELKKFRAEITALSIHEDFFCSDTDATLSFLNEEGQQSQRQSWEKFSGYCSEETNVVGLEQQVKDLVSGLIPEMNCNHDLSSTRNHSSEGIVEIPAEQDGDDRCTQFIAEIGGEGSGKTVNNQSDENPSDLDPNNYQPSEKNYFWMSLRSACERGPFIIPGIIFVVKTYLRRFLRKTVITLLRSIIDTIDCEEGNHSTNQVIAGVSEEIQEDQISVRDGNNSNNQVIAAVGKEIQEEQILEKDVNKSINQVIAVVGEAGSGKSTLASTVYNRNDVKQHFTMRACVRVSSKSKARDVLLSILKQTKDDVSDLEKPLEIKETLSEKELISHLKKRLKDINYLIVIEDVETTQVWRAVRDALSDSSCHRGNIIITSRNPNATLDADLTLRMLPLNDEASWKLFLEKAQSAEDPEFMRTSKENILRICGGLPSRIVWLGGLLSTNEPTDWPSLTGTHESAEDTYTDLPSQVKPCFLYMALFPKGHEIPVRRLIHLWCAEGFVTPSTCNEMIPKDLAEKILPEDLAEIYFLVLVIRNMIHVRWNLDGSPKTCRMHDHLHAIFSQRAADVGFFYHDRYQQFHTAVNQAQFAVRRLAAAYFDNHDFPSSFLDLTHLRSCVVFDTRGQPRIPASAIRGFLNKIIVNRDFVLLKVLDLEGVYKPTLSDAVENLLQLRYLGLRSTFIDSLASFVGFLPYLETLDLKHTKIEKLPSSIWKAKELQHLYLDWSHPGIIVDSSFPKPLSNLRTLWGLCIEDDGSGKFDSTSALKIITQLTQLQSLKVKLLQKESVARRGRRQQSIQKTSSSHLQLQSMEKLRNLYLMGKLEKQLNDVRFLPPNLGILTLSGSRLEEDPMPVLEKLCYLKILRLFPDSYVGREMKCCLEGFPQLHVLKLRKLEQLERWTVEEGAMPCLQHLEIRECNQLRVPRELERYLTT